MSKFIEVLTLLILILLALYTVNTSKLRRSIIYLGGFSLLSSFIYLFYSAPDVAIAEAIIGCTLSIILLLTAIKRYKILTIYYINEDEENDITNTNSMLIDLENYLIKHDFQPMAVRTSLDDPSLHENDAFDLLVIDNPNLIHIYSRSTSFNTDIVKDFIEEYAKEHNIEVDFIPLVEEMQYEG